MAKAVHRNSRTTEAMRRAIQESPQSLRALARRYKINLKTVAKWKGRKSVADLPTTRKDQASSALTREDEAVIVAFRRHTLFSLDECLSSLRAALPHLTRSGLYRCLRRHGINRVPETDGRTPPERRSEFDPLGTFRIDVSEIRTTEGKLHIFVAIDRTSKLSFVEVHENATTHVAHDVLHRLVDAVPYRVHTVLTDEGSWLTPRAADGSMPPLVVETLAEREASWAHAFWSHAFELGCAKLGIDHHVSQPNCPWPDEIDRMHRTINYATGRRPLDIHRDRLRSGLGSVATC